MHKIFLSVVITFLLTLPAMAADQKESAFDRVMRTNVIRCGYYVFPPVTYRDPNTNAMSGFTVDMMNEIAERASMKVEWTEETNFTNWVPGLQANRYDLACTPNWPDIPQGRVVSFSTPMFFAGLYPMVRADDTRFQDDISVLNNKDVIFAAPEGDALVSLIKSHFPLAQIHVMPPGGDISSFALEVSTKKADAFLTDRNGMVEFNRNNPNKMRLMAQDKPVKLQSFNLAVDVDEIMLKDWINNAILDLQNDGTMDRLLAKWEPEPHKTFLRVVMPTETGK